MRAADVVEQPILKDGAPAPPSPPIRHRRWWDHNHIAYRALHSGASGAARRAVRCSFGVGVVFALLLIYSQCVTRQTPTYLEAGRPDGAASVALQESAGGSEALLGVARALGINVAISSVGQNGYLLPAVLRRVSTERRRQWEAARDLYERERPHFKRAAHEFELHPYWRGLSADEASFEALVGARAADMAAQLQQAAPPARRPHLRPLNQHHELLHPLHRARHLPFTQSRRSPGSSGRRVATTSRSRRTSARWLPTWRGRSPPRPISHNLPRPPR